jgi:hypothetical protein
MSHAAAATGAVTLIQRFGSAANLNIHLHGLVLDGVYHTGTEGALVFHPAPALTGEKLQALLGKIITRILRRLTREGHLVEEEGLTYVADAHGSIDPDNLLAPLQAASCTYRIALGPRVGRKVLSLQYHGHRLGASICFRRLETQTRTGFSQSRWVSSACARTGVRTAENRTQ